MKQNYFLHLLFCTFLFWVPGIAIAQAPVCPPVVTNTITVGPTAPSVCPGKFTRLWANATSTAANTNSYRIDSFPYAPYSYTLGTAYSASFDDQYGGVVHLPFPFCFYGNTYQDIVIGTNGEICFDTTQANHSCPWSIVGPLPASNSNATLNCILGAYYDIDYATGQTPAGSIRYATYGTAPCRVFVVSNFEVPLFSCTSELATQQIVLHESTNQIDVNIASKPQCSNWNNGYAILGIENSSGTSFVTAPGKNATDWSGTNLSYSFIPTGTGNTIVYRWYDPLGNYVASGDTINVNPTTQTPYTVKASIYAGCDSFLITDVETVFINSPPVVNFTDVVNYGCSQDTVHFINQTSGTGNTYFWYYGDGSARDTFSNPQHIYITQDTFNVRLIATTSAGCVDSVTTPLYLIHPLKASFTVDHDSICQYRSVTFANTSVYTSQNGNPSYLWNFGDGTTDTNASPTHQYMSPGLYHVTMRITNFVPCSDSASIYINVDTVTFINVTLSDSVLCEGRAATFYGIYSTLGNVGTSWDFGDGTVIKNRSSIEHAYESAGNYVITFTSNYRICPDTSFAKSVTVYNYPTLNLGPDTSLCPGSASIPIGDMVNSGNPLASWIWSTGDTSSGINASAPGVYYATVSINGCSTADSIWVKNDCYINIPNVFTPNNDGVNDYFFPRQMLSSSVTTFEMVIYNRWGQQIFETKSLDGRGWDGKVNNVDQPSGAYIYIIDVSFKDGNSEHHQGNVTLLR